MNITLKEKELGYKVIKTPTEYGSIFDEPEWQRYVALQKSVCEYILRMDDNVYVYMRWGRDLNLEGTPRWYPLSEQFSDPSENPEIKSNQEITGEPLPECH